MLDKVLMSDKIVKAWVINLYEFKPSSTVLPEINEQIGCDQKHNHQC